MLNEINTIGADDGYFDYYPELVTICDQLTMAVSSAIPNEGLQYINMLNWVRQTAVNFRYFNLEEGIELVGADLQALEVRNQYLRRGWLAPLGDIYGQFRYTEKFRASIDDTGALDIPEWIFLP